MKVLSLLLLVIIFSFPIFAQDVIHLKNGDKYSGKVQEIRPAEIVLVIPDAPKRIILKRDIKVIVYENGEIEMFDTNQNEIREQEVIPSINKKVLDGILIFGNVGFIDTKIKEIDNYIYTIRDNTQDSQTLNAYDTDYGKDGVLYYGIIKKIKNYAIGFERQSYPTTSADVYAYRMWDNSDTDHGYILSENITEISRIDNYIIFNYYFPQYKYLGDAYIGVGYGSSSFSLDYEFLLDYTDWSIWPSEYWATEIEIDKTSFTGSSKAYQLSAGWELEIWRGISLITNLKYVQSFKGKIKGDYTIWTTTGIGTDISPYNYYHESIDSKSFLDNEGDPIIFDFSYFIMNFGFGYTF